MQPDNKGGQVNVAAPRLFFDWITQEAIPKLDVLSEALHENGYKDPDAVARALIPIAIKPFFYWAQDHATKPGTVHSPSPNEPSSLSHAGPQGDLSSWITGHPQLTLVSGPPGVTKLGFKEKVSPELWDTTHRLAKAAGYVYVPYDRSSGESGHWKKVTA